MMMPPPLRSELRDGILELTLDTPGGAVNVFTREAAANLCAILESVTRVSARAVVLRSGKPRSFLNGVGLLMAGSAKSAEDAVAMARPVRDAYRALRDCPVPTIAAIDGNCYGCGVELVLQCKYRLAANTFDTHFFMTEMADYLFIPIFGGTQNLPRLLGLERAIDFVMWGRRLSAAQALTDGLVDRCFDPATFDTEVDGFVRAVAAGATAPRPLARALAPREREQVLDANRERIRRLPPAYRELYLSCLALMQSAADKPELADGDYDHEASESGRSIVAPPCRAAWPFFFQRQMARALAVAGAPGARMRGLGFETHDASLEDLAAELSKRCAPATRSVQGGPRAAAASQVVMPAVLRLRRYVATTSRDSVPLESGRFSVSDGVSGEPFNSRGGVVLHAPLRRAGIDVAEIAFTGQPASTTEQALSSALADAYFTVVRTRPQGLFVLDDILSAWLAPQVAFLEAGGAPADLAGSLRAFGFTRLAGDWIGPENLEALSNLVRRRLPALEDPRATLGAVPGTAFDEGRHDPAIVSAVLVSLGGLACRLLRDRSVPHVAFVDVAARELIDFPLQHTSLCRYLTVSKATQLLAARSTFGHLVAPEDLESLEEFVAQGREHYVGINLA